MAKEKQVGFAYYVGIHFVMCHGPVDSLLRIRVDDRDVWLGEISGNESIHLLAEELFGGWRREGGISGTLDFMPGAIDQLQNWYLRDNAQYGYGAGLGELLPAYRGVAGTVLRQMYIGMNPYLKPWSFALQRIHTRKDGEIQWYDSKAEITTNTIWNKQQYIFFSIDASMKMDGYIDFVKQQMGLIIDELNKRRKDSNVPLHVAIFLSAIWGYPYMGGVWEYFTDANVQEVKNFFNTWYKLSDFKWGMDYNFPFGEAKKFLTMDGTDITNSTKTMFCISGGLPQPSDSIDKARTTAYDMIYRTDSNNPVDIYCINVGEADTSYTSELDNTPSDKVPVATISSTHLFDLVMYSSMTRTGTMNPAHIIRECLTDPKWGMGYQDSDIDEASFIYAADMLHSEGMGMSILWDAESTIEDFIKLVCRHIDATVFVDRHTGLFVLKLIRKDYDASSLLILSPYNILSIQDFTRPSFGDLINSVTLTYHNVASDGPATISVQDIALAQEQRVTINQSVTYEGFVDATLASKIAQRDLKVLSTPLISCTVVANQDAKDLNIGSVFKLTWPDYDISEVIMRVTSVAFGDGKSNRIRIGCAQDVFAFPETAFIAAPPPLQPGTGQVAQPITQRMVFEVPYLQLVQEHGQLQVDTVLAPANSPDAGYVGAAAARPSNAEILASIYTDSGVGYFVYRNSLDFCPSAILDVEIDRMATEFVIKNVIDSANIRLGTWLQVDSELMYIQQMNGATLTVKRAVLDTVPYEHVAGALILFWDAISDKDEIEYAMSDVVDVKLTSTSGAGELPLASVPIDTVVIGARAIRPYPPADVKVNGEYFPTEVSKIELTWVARNRIQQTAPILLGFTDPGITAEPNTLYTVRVYDHNDLLLHEVLNVDALSYVVPTDIVQNMAGSGVVSLGSVRDGWYSTYLHNIPLTIFVVIPIPPGDALDFVVDEVIVLTDGGALNFNMGV